MPGKWINLEWYTEREVAEIEYLQSVLYLLELGREDEIVGPSITYQPPPMAEEDVERVITAIDEEFEYEIRRYPKHHFDSSGAETTPDFHRLKPETKRKVVEALQQIKENTEHDKPIQTSSGIPITYTPPPVPEDVDYEYWAFWD